MARPTTKKDFITAAEANYKEMNDLISSLTEKELSTPFTFDDTKKEAHWKRDKNLRDVLIHLYEWHQLLLVWVSWSLQIRRGKTDHLFLNRTTGKLMEK